MFKSSNQIKTLIILDCFSDTLTGTSIPIFASLLHPINCEKDVIYNAAFNISDDELLLFLKEQSYSSKLFV